MIMKRPVKPVVWECLSNPGELITQWTLDGICLRSRSSCCGMVLANSGRSQAKALQGDSTRGIARKMVLIPNPVVLIF